ncbi:hypothetical protein C823_003341 [Eubacterium plexicaudatum ASF492]|uniref:Uncharacterized protein n=1 Tax=Eubacterium plexicaudatum ASF492 TaxID=1235802 RepID=N2AU48_9FIRM|nr:hypothetical protein C823_003341 [Eubacterium plexicaudatum ASF492]
MVKGFRRALRMFWLAIGFGVGVHAGVFSVLTPVVDDFFDIVLMISNGVCAKIAVGTFVPKISALVCICG